MPWYLTFESLRRASQFLGTHQRSSKPDLSKCERIATISLHLPQYGYYSQYRFPSRGFASFLLYNTHNRLRRRSGFSKSYSLISSSTIVKHHVRTYWRRVWQKYNCSSHSLTRVSQIARVFSFALTHSHLIVPGILCLARGKVALAQSTLADTHCYPLRNPFYTRAQKGHLHLKSFVFSFIECLVLLARALYLAILFSPSIMMAPFVDNGGPRFRKLWLQIVHSTLEKAGPVFIKLGQWAATRPDLFPRDLCKKLSELQSNAPQHSFAHTKKTIEGAFGCELSDIFVSFEKEPVASGSIAQVHRASYRNPDPQVKPMSVAVKVRHPWVHEAIGRDLVIINFMAKISNFIPHLKRLRLDEIAPQFAVIMMPQVDLAREAANLNRFIYNFRKRKNVSFPKPVYPFVHPAVLVETYEQGESVSHYLDDLEGHGKIKTHLAHIGTEALLRMLLVDNFFHADLHPGNMLVRLPKTFKVDNRLHADMHHGNIRVRLPKKKLSTWQPFKSKPHIIFIDAGMTVELSNSDQLTLENFFKAVICRDGRTAAESVLRFSEQQKCPDPKAFVKDAEESFTFWRRSPEGDVIHHAECMEQLLEKVRRHKVNIDGNVCTVLVTTLVLAGMQRKLDPTYDLMQTIKEILFPEAQILSPFE